MDFLHVENSAENERAAFLSKYGSHFVFILLSYDLKNSFESSLHSSNPNYSGADGSYWIVYKNVVACKSGNVALYCLNGEEDELWKDLLSKTETLKRELKNHYPVQFKQRTSREEYLNDVVAIQELIRCGSIYELNYCQEFYAENVKLDVLDVFNNMRVTNAAPFSVLIKWHNNFIIGASPERFLAKRGQTLIAQPIKGTRRRLALEEADLAQKRELQEDIKERAENVMIVDLMRNDLARCCKTGSIQVEELFGIYSFATVHQMISTITGTKSEHTTFENILAATFPMGSMTGAPKIESMKLIDQFEKVRRGWFSGSVGYIDPNGDFDLNVVIRTLIYNASTDYLSLQTGGAITVDSVPEQEYQESLLKAEAWIKLLA